MKTPLKDNLNFKSLNFIKKLIPQNSTVSSFLLYSGILDCGLAADNRYVTSHTEKYCIYEFWNCVLDDPKKVAGLATTIYNRLTKVPAIQLGRLIETLQGGVEDNSDDYYVRAAYFFLLNQISDCGSVSSGTTDLRKFNPVSLHTLQNFKINNFHLSYEEGEDFLETLKKQESDFLLLPVGNYSRNLFERGTNKGWETTTIYHSKLFDSIASTDTKWVTIYKKHLDIFDIYKDYNLFMVDKRGRQTIKKNNCEDIIIANF